MSAPELPGIVTDAPPDPRYTVDDYSAGGLLVQRANMQDAWTRNPVPSIARWLERQGYEETTDEFGNVIAPRAEVRRLSADEANQVYGIDGHLHFPKEVPEPVAQDLYRLKRAELGRQDLLRRREGGALQEAGLIAGGFLATAADPLNIASAFIPVVGPTRYALALKQATTAGERALIRAGVGALEGAVGAAVVEPIVYGVAADEQADYSLADSLLNVAFGTVLGGGLHAGAGAIGDRLGISAVAAERRGHFEALRAVAGRDATLLEAIRLAEADQLALSPLVRAIEAAPLEVKEAALRQAVTDLVLHGEVRNVDALLRSAMGRALDDVLADPLRGARSDILATIPLDAVRAALVERGPGALAADGSITVKSGRDRGEGLLKVVWEHGEKSSKDPALRVQRPHIEALPETLRDWRPTQILEDGRAEWRRELPGADGKPVTVVYALSGGRPDGNARLATIYVQDPRRAGADAPVSLKWSDTVESVAGSASRSELGRPLADTGRAVASPDTAGRTAATSQTLYDPADPDKLAAAALAPLARAATAFDQLAARAGKAAASVADPVLERAMAMIEGLQKLGRVKEADLAPLREADELVKRAEGERQAWDIAAACAVGRGA